jgi:hypothetical protein
VSALMGGVVMPNARFYIRNHFQIPNLNAAHYRLAVGGLVRRKDRVEHGENGPAHSSIARVAGKNAKYEKYCRLRASAQPRIAVFVLENISDKYQIDGWK